VLVRDFATPADLALCRQMIRQGSKSFHLASLLLPAIYREQARALYGFCRMADDLIDNSVQPQAAVLTLKARLDAIYAGHPGDDPTDRAFADLVRRFAIPRAIPEALIDGFVWDATGRRYETFSDVTAYGVRVAGTVGVMMALVMGERRPQALARAIDLGVAMQFSNIARDIEDDARLGRVYLPADWLAADGCSPEEMLSRPSIGVKSASRLVAEAEQLYASAASGIAMLPRSCRASINAARLLYREIGLTARNQHHAGRAIVPRGRKLALAARAAALSPFLRPGLSAPALPEGQFLIDAVAETVAPPHAYKGVSGQLEWVMQMFSAVEARKS
jgi:15-cis-phytoene synthase